MRNKDTITATGYLEVIKLYPDGTQEVHWADKNTITSGLGITLAYLFSEQFSTNILDYQFSYTQIGVSALSNYGASTTGLGSAIPATYLSSTDLVYNTHSQLRNGVTFTDQPFIYIAPNNVFKASNTSVRYNIVVPQNSLNLGVPINEIGLFSKNPRAQTPEESILVAYKTFSNIVKTSDFTLLFRWTLTF